MLRIRLLQEGRIVETIDAKWTLDITEIAAEADKLGPQYDADDWEVVNETDMQVLTKERWTSLRR